MDNVRPGTSLLRVITAFVILSGISMLMYVHRQQTSVQLAVAKGKRLFDMSVVVESGIHEAILAELNMSIEDDGGLSLSQDYEFVSALPLSYGEASQWRSDGCLQASCAHILYYDYAGGGTFNAIIRLDDSAILAQWSDPMARPGGSSVILSKAMAIAAADPQVRTLFGDIGSPDPAMIPMSGWLMDDACRDAWCVDLTYHDPEGSGRIVHVFVNLEKNEVARVFYTRGRPDRSLAKPLPQRDAYEDGCHQQYEWEVCWEMTAHDGVNFRDGVYAGQQVFSSVKITQIEAWYPAWPGGYRDEIGFAASVPAIGGTVVNDFANGFEVRQLFTEFTHWPNCICCYRYEEIIRFYADGSLEFEFVSHGPGCDDIPLYRPFWRIDLDVDGPDADEAWFWQEGQWQEALSEIELFPFVDDLSPGGAKVATFDGDLNYFWRMLLTDPLGRDESHFFILQDNELEGEGPVVPGPGDTYRPPRQWIDGDVPSGNDIVLWFVPTLEQIKGGPWWCMPDPEPDFSPCDVILRAELGEELRQPSAEEITRTRPTPTETAPPVGTTTLTPEITATATATSAPTATPRPLEGEDVATILSGAGCSSCHVIGSIGERHKVGPNLSNIGRIAGQRVQGLSAEEYLRQAILEPNAFIAPTCPNGPCLPNIMPSDYGRRMSLEQVELLVSFLLEQTEELSQPVIIGDGQVDEQPTALPKAFPAPKRISGRPPDSTAGLALQLMILSIVFLLTMFRLLKQRRQNSD